MCAQVISSPACSITAPRGTSSPAKQMFFMCPTGAYICTCSMPSSVSSWRMTQSQPAGTGAPVMMRSASPRPTENTVPQPAQASPTTRSTAGCSRDACAMSSLCRA